MLQGRTKRTHTIDWHDHCRLFQMPKRWTCNKTLIHLSSAHKAPMRPSTRPLWNNTRLLPKTRRPHEYLCCQHCWRRNRFRWDQRREIPIVRENTHKYTRAAVQYACVVVLLSLSLSLFLSFSDIPPTHAHPNVETHAHAHALISNPPTCFHIYTVWMVHILHLHSVQQSGHNLYHNSASVQRVSRYSNVWASLDDLWSIHNLDSCFSFTLFGPINPHTCWNCDEVDRCTT